jgi:Zn-dependent peptidase ImmA (M78 family)
MPAADLVPINPSVLAWAMEEASVGPPELAAALHVNLEDVEGWLAGDERPPTTHFRKLASHLRRSTATFLLPEPPPASVPPAFRHPPGADKSRRITRDEASGVRTARRLQSLARWVSTDMPGHFERAPLPSIAMQRPSVEAANALRDWLGWTVERQINARDAYAALADMRAALEARGVLVFHLRLGEQGCRGFSLGDPIRPVIAANRRYIPAARLFTYGHELAHLVSGTQSLCLTRFQSSTLERWCEGVAGELLLPRDALRAYVRKSVGVNEVGTVAQVRRIASRYKTSLRATAYRLQETQLAEPGLYGLVHTSTDLPTPSKDPPRERRSQRRYREFGRGFTEQLVSAEASGALTHHDLVNYLDLPANQLDEWRSFILKD